MEESQDHLNNPALRPVYGRKGKGAFSIPKPNIFGTGSLVEIQNAIKTGQVSLKDDRWNETELGVTSPLLSAVRNNGREDVINFLLEEGCSVNVLDQNQNSVLFYALCRKLSKELLDKIFRLCTSTILRSCGRYNLLGKAIECKHREIIDYFLDNDLHIHSYSHSSPLIVAASEGDTQTLARLLKIPNINLEATDFAGDTALMNAVTLNSDSETSIMLLKAGANINVKDWCNDSLISNAFRQKRYGFLNAIVTIPNIEICRQNASKGVLFLTNNENFEVMDALVKTKKIKTNHHELDKDGSSFLLLMNRLSLDNFEHILKHWNVDRYGLNQCITTVNTLIQEIFVRYRRPSDKYKIIKLIEYGIGIHRRDVSGQGVLWKAVERGDMDIARALLDKGANPGKGDVPPVHMAIQNNETDMVLLFLDRNPECVTSINHSNSETTLHVAVRLANIELIQKILEMNQVDVDAHNKKQETTLHYAARLGVTPIFKVLVEKGANLMATSYKNDTIFHYAARNAESKGVLHYVMRLRNRPIPLIDAANRYGNTPLHVSAKRNIFEMVINLIGKGAKCDILNSQGLNPMDLAYVSDSRASLDIFAEIYNLYPSENVMNMVINSNIVILIGNLTVDERVMRQEVECPICLIRFEIGQEISLMKDCTHFFHTNCINRWILKKVGNRLEPTCALCNTTINKSRN